MQMKTHKTFYLIQMLLISIFLLLGLYPAAFAESATTKADLVQMISQLDALLITIDDAEQNQTPNERVQFHFSRFKNDADQYQNGLREDITTIRNSLIDYLNHQTLEAVNIKPLTTDFVSGNRHEP